MLITADLTFSSYPNKPRYLIFFSTFYIKHRYTNNPLSFIFLLIKKKSNNDKPVIRMIKSSEYGN